MKERLRFRSNHSDFKGLLEPPIMGQTILTQWLMCPVKLGKLVKWWLPLQLLTGSDLQTPSGPTLYSTTFPILASGGDTFSFYLNRPRAKSGSMGLTGAGTEQSRCHNRPSTYQASCCILEHLSTKSHCHS